MLDQRARTRELGGVAALGEDLGGTDRGEPRDRGDQLGEVELVEDPGHASLDLREPAMGRPPVLEHEVGSFQGASALHRDAGSVAEGVEHGAHDRRVPAGGAPTGQLTAHSPGEAFPAHAPQPGRVAVGALEHQGDASSPQGRGIGQ